MLVTVEMKRPECDDNCKECKYLKIEDTSFDHEFGTEHRESWECSAKIEDLELLGECPIIDTLIDDNFTDEVIADLTLEVY